MGNFISSCTLQIQEMTGILLLGPPYRTSFPVHSAVAQDRAGVSVACRFVVQRESSRVLLVTGSLRVHPAPAYTWACIYLYQHANPLIKVGQLTALSDGWRADGPVGPIRVMR